MDAHAARSTQRLSVAGAEAERLRAKHQSVARKMLLSLYGQDSLWSMCVCCDAWKGLVQKQKKARTVIYHWAITHEKHNCLHDEQSCRMVLQLWSKEAKTLNRLDTISQALHLQRMEQARVLGRSMLQWEGEHRSVLLRVAWKTWLSEFSQERDMRMQLSLLQQHEVASNNTARLKAAVAKFVSRTSTSFYRYWWSHVAFSSWSSCTDTSIHVRTLSRNRLAAYGHREATIPTAIHPRTGSRSWESILRPDDREDSGNPYASPPANPYASPEKLDQLSSPGSCSDLTANLFSRLSPYGSRQMARLASRPP